VANSIKKVKAKASAKNNKPAKKKVIKYRLLHVPSGQHLHLGINTYSNGGEGKSPFGYVSLWKTLSIFMRDFRVINLQRTVPLYEQKVDNTIELCIPGSTEIISHFSLTHLIRTDVLDASYQNWPYPDDSFYLTENRDRFERFKNNPLFFFEVGVNAGDDITCPYCDELVKLGNADEYGITCNNVLSWDTIFTELFKYLQDNSYHITLSQFSKDKKTQEKIMLMEFEIVKVEV
jgi:hypothetical protein